MIKGLSFTKDSPRVDLPDMPRGLEPGLCVRTLIRRTGTEPHQCILELGTADGARILLETGESPDTLVLAQLIGTIRKQIAARGVLPAGRWVQITVRLEPDGDAQIEVFDLVVKRANIGKPVPGGRTQNFLARGTSGSPFIGSLSQLEIWRSPSPEYLSSGSPKLDSGRLWAYYAMDQLLEISETTDSGTQTYYRIPDAGVLVKHARVQAPLASVQQEEPLCDSKARVTTLVDEDHAVRLAPLSDLSDGVTIEAWIRASDLSQPRTLLQLRDPSLFHLGVGTDGTLTLVCYGSATGAAPVELVRASGAIQAGVFTHVAVAITRPLGEFLVSLYVQGQLRAEASLRKDPREPLATLALFAALSGLGRSSGAQLLLGGAGAHQLGVGLKGNVAEVRAWSKGLSRDEIGARWLTRVCGDEPGLLACYRMDASVEGCALDLSPQRGVGVLPAGTIVGDVIGFPLLSVSGPERVRIVARGKLVKETLLNKVILLSVTGGRELGDPITATATNQVRFERRPTLVFDATIEPRSPSGASLAGQQLEVRLDEAMTMLRDAGEDTEYEPWSAGTTYRVPIPNTGKVRLRFEAKQLGCPAVRVRVAGRPADAWTVVRPDEKAHRQIRSTTGSDLLSPSDGRSSPLPAGTSSTDASALADALTKLGRVLPPGPNRSRFIHRQSRNIFEDAWNSTTDAVEDAADTVVDGGRAVIDGAGDSLGELLEGAGDITRTIVDGSGNVLGKIQDGVLTVTESGAKIAQRLPRTAGQLLGTSGSALTTLIDNSRKAAAQLGESAIKTFLDSADSVAIVVQSTAADVIHSLEIVGSVLLSGATGYWRVIVRGVKEALAAIQSVIERIGAVIKDVLEYLSYLFRWGDFLAASDEAYAMAEGAIGRVPAMIADLAQYKPKITGYLNTSLGTSALNQSIGQLCGIDLDPHNPVIEDLEYFIEKVQKVQDYVDSLTASATSAASGGPTLPDAARLSTQASAGAKLLPCGALTNPATALSTPINELLKNAAGLGSSSGSLLDALFDSLLSETQQLVEEGTSVLQARISMGALTGFIEDVILGGRKLNALRIVALCAAIPKVLYDKISGDARTANISMKALLPVYRSAGSTDESADEESGHEPIPAWLIWIPWALGLCANIFLVADTVREMGEKESSAKASGAKFMQFGCGFMTALKALFLSGQIEYLPTGARPWAKASCALEGLAGVWMVLSLIAEEKGLMGEALRQKVDVVIYGILTTSIMITTLVPICSQVVTGTSAITSASLRGGEYMFDLLSRALSAADNSDTTGKTKRITLGFLGAGTVVALTEAIYSTVTQTS